MDLCDSGARAIAKCKEKKYDLLLLDHMMPKPDGMEVLKTLRRDSDSLNKETPALMLTANAIAGCKEEYLKAGFADYLSKPLDSSALEKAVKSNLPKDRIVPVTLQKNKGSSAPHNTSLKERLSNVSGLNYESAISYCVGDEEFLLDMLKDIVAESEQKASDMEKALKEQDYEAYGILAHSIKGIMATVGVQSLSDQAKAQDEATRIGNTDVVLNEGQDFIENYRRVCESMKKALE